MADLINIYKLFLHVLLRDALAKWLKITETGLKDHSIVLTVGNIRRLRLMLL